MSKQSRKPKTTARLLTLSILCLISLTVGCKTIQAPSITPYSELVSPPERPYLAPIETIKDAGIRLTNTLSHIEKQEVYIKDMEGYYLEVIEIISR